MTRRESLIGLAGLVSAVALAGSLGLPAPVAAQNPTQQEMKTKGRAAVQKGRVKWESLTPEQQAAMKETFKEDAEKAQEKWNAMTPEQQQQAIAKTKGAGQKARQKWQSLPKQ